MELEKRSYPEMMRRRWAEGKQLCIGLDPATISDLIAPHLYIGHRIVQFLCPIIEATHEFVCAFKPNLAFYLSKGTEGFQALQEVSRFIGEVAPEVPVILDGKFGDIGKTNKEWFKFAYEVIGADAVTVNPFVGIDDVAPFAGPGNCAFALCHTSNKAAAIFQESVGTNGQPLFLKVDEEVVKRAREKGENWGLVVGATYPEQLLQVRSLARNLPLLIPGIGAQGGDLEATVKAGRDDNCRGMVINVSSSILYASTGPDFVEAAYKEAKRLHEAIRNASIAA